MAPRDNATTAQKRAAELQPSLLTRRHVPIRFVHSLSESSVKSPAHIGCCLELLMNMSQTTSRTSPPLRRYPREEVLDIFFLARSFM
jgi:hypothetical protein